MPKVSFHVSAYVRLTIPNNKRELQVWSNDSASKKIMTVVSTKVTFLVYKSPCSCSFCCLF